ncbi:hypothetical protein ONZ45_g12648 [Pleurotus djamor]|nr:hypothetical protein ONZ45_g12648 [Pleurotus djamor]
MKSVFALAIIAASLAVAEPANDWSRPCFDGECAYDLPGTAQHGSGTFKLSGSSKAITDITPAAGWVVLECDPHLLQQEIRLVCQGSDEAACGHLFEHGPEHKVVRLPESCGAGPFARIASAHVAGDQSIPGHVQLTRRDGVEPQVHVLKVDTAWDLVDVAKHVLATGEIAFAFMGSSMPGPVGIMNYNNFTVNQFPVEKRGADGKWSDFFGKAIDKLKKFASDLKDGIAENTKVQLEIEKVKLTLSSEGEKKHDIFPKQSVDCPWGKGSVEGAITAKYSVTAHVGGAVTGTLVPPKAVEVAVLAGFAGEVDLRLHIKAQAEISGKSPSWSLPPFNPTPLQIAGVISLGPHISVEAYGEAGVKLTGDIDIGANLKVEDIEFWYPPKAIQDNTFVVQKMNAPLTLNADTQASGSLTAGVHVVPKVSLGLTGLAGQAEATAWIALDGYVTAELKGEGHAGATHKRSHSRDLDLVARNAGAGYSGSVVVNAGFKMKGGLTGKILDAKVQPEAELTKHNWEIYKHTFSGGKAKRDFVDMVDSSLVSRANQIAEATDAFTCPKLMPSFFKFPSK